MAEQFELLVGADPGDRVGELARHWMAATAPADVSKAVRYTAAAGARALDQWAPDEALRWYGEARNLVERHDSDDAERWFEEAMAMHDGMESPLFVAYTDAAWSAMLADRNRGEDHQRARTMADRAVTAATAGGYGYIQSDALAVLARTRTSMSNWSRWLE